MPDYIQLEFLDGTVLNLNNDIELDGSPVPLTTGEPVLHSLMRALTGCTILNVDINAEYLALEFSGKQVLKMTLKSEEWRAPEAFSLFIPGEPPIVLTETPT